MNRRIDMKLRMLKSVLSAVFLAILAGPGVADNTGESQCFESRKGNSEVIKRDIRPGLPNVKCSPRTGGVLWWGDPFDGTVPMGEMPVEAGYSHAEAVVRPREEQMDKRKLLSICTTACHNGDYVPVPTSMEPRPLKMHQDIVPDSMNLQHGRGAIWCLNCHSAENRSKLIDNFGKEISFNQPQKLCGKCHGPIYRDWRDGIHGKRIGMWAAAGKKDGGPVPNVTTRMTCNTGNATQALLNCSQRRLQRRQKACSIPILKGTQNMATPPGGPTFSRHFLAMMETMVTNRRLVKRKVRVISAGFH